MQNAYIVKDMHIKKYKENDPPPQKKKEKKTNTEINGSLKFKFDLILFQVFFFFLVNLGLFSV